MNSSEEHSVANHGKSRSLRESMESLIERRSSNYQQALKRCRKKFSEKTVHALRVEIRRMLSMLTLLEAVWPGKLVDPIRDRLQGRLKAFSRLRDTQVQLMLIKELKEMVKGGPELEAFQQSLRRRERRLVRRLTRELKAARHGKVRRRITRLRRAMDRTMNAASRARRVEAALLRAMGHAFEDVEAHYRRADATDITTIHRMRVAFKKFRYMAESLAQVRPGVSERRLRTMHDYQTRMGEIQDVEVLLACAKKFARKRESALEALGPFREELRRRRARLVARFMASADQLRDFWPAPPALAATGRKATAQK